MDPTPGYAAATNTGHIRASNEDRYLATPPLFAVADGMGGQAAGEVAAQIVVDALAKASADGEVSEGRALGQVLEDANRVVIARARADPELRGMGTTCSALLIDGHTAHIAHVGDSRGYLIRDGAFRSLTTDHTAVGQLERDGRLTPAEAAVHPQRHILSRAIGAADDVEVELSSVDLRPGDRIMLCSDGLSGMVQPIDIERILTSTADPAKAAAALIEAALAGGGNDNVTVVVIDPTPVAGQAVVAPTDDVMRATVAPRRRRPIVLLLIAALLAAALVLAQSDFWQNGAAPIVAPTAPAATPSPALSPTPSLSTQPLPSATSASSPTAPPAAIPSAASPSVAPSAGTPSASSYGP